ncbi:M81 family metallopeptidase [Pseudotabrizicola sp. 4114]|uniref:M81 family metallopeptidase n=1 Tax=Pseudotabrizicola sp. 4114 TaxID=2817731 RepID=UPI00285B257C|nr:microcystin degradation protein MlrC [Pseudorhodobacter sp. 4114]
MSFHVLTAELIQECNTFQKGRTGLEQYRVEILASGEEALSKRRHAVAEIKGFMDVAEAEGWRVTHALSATATPGPIVTAEAFAHLAGMITDAAQAAGKLDGVLLALHGAMVAEGVEDPEGELLTRLRAILGPDVPIAVTLDLHTNTTPEMAAGANVIVSFKTYPHVDPVETAVHAAQALKVMMAGRAQGRTLRLAVPMLDEANSGRSDVLPTMEFYDRARRYETEPGIMAVSVNAGFSDADIYHCGPSVLVSYDASLNGAEARAEAIALDLGTAIWEARHSCANRFLTVEQACQAVRDFRADRPGPLVIADFSDNPGSGAYGDATNLLAGLLGLGLRDAAFGPLIDPGAAAELQRHRVGETVTLAIGGKADPRYGGGPITVTGEIRHLSAEGVLVGDGPVIGGITFRFGPTAVLRVNGIDVLIVTERGQAYDLQQFKAFGITPEACTVLGLKSQQHFRAAFEPIAAAVIVCDCGGLATPDYSKRRYEKVRRPIWPLDEMPEGFRPILPARG